MYILGIHHGHDASVALIKDGKVIFYIQEERLAAIKHYANLPVRALDLCFKTTGIHPKDIDFVVVPGLGRIVEINRLLNISETVRYDDTSSDSTRFADWIRRIALELNGYFHYLNPLDTFGFPVYRSTYSLKASTKLYQINHHLCHAASAYYTSGFDRCLTVTSDGSGDALSATIWMAENGKLTPLTKIGRNGSLGFFYNIVTEALGWQIGEGEGKVMGLAPYGNTKKTKGVLEFITPHFHDGKLVKPRHFGFPSYWRADGLFHWHFSQSEIVKKLIDTYGRENIAAEAQRVLEEQMLNFVIPWIKRTGAENLAAAGGVFLNVKMNQRIWETNFLKKLYVYPDSGDAGLSVGAALYLHHRLDHKYIPSKIMHTYWGPEYSDAVIEKTLKTRNLTYVKYKNIKQLIKNTASWLADGKIIGWFQGKMEAGPRALGNRSILMDPRKAENKDIINSRVKYREAFRPFCPSLLDTAAKKYLVNPVSPEFMIISFDVPKDKIKEIPAVVHVDGTARPQVVTKRLNPLYYQLIQEFGKITGVPVLLNTSFNIRGQPIVCTPADAIKCFYDTGLDYLILGRYLLKKENDLRKSD